MNGGIPFLIGMPVIVLVAASLFLLGMVCYKKALGITTGNAAFVFFACLATSAASVFYFLSEEPPGRRFEQQPLSVILARGLLPFFAIPFLVNLYRRWIGNQLTEVERTPGIDGMRAWLRGGNFICAILISLCACLGYDYSFWGLLALTVMALLAYPVLNMASTSFQPASPKTEDLSSDRERVLRMLDEGKITADESAELLNALSQTMQPSRPPASTAADPHRKMMLTGLVLLLIGFFLPWFSFNLDNEMARVLSGMQEQMSKMSKQNPGVTFQMPNSGSVHISGSEIRYGLGWFVLLLGIAAAALPYIASHHPPDAQHKARLITLGVGSIILIYLLTENLRFASVGILLGLAGYALQWVGTLKERRGVLK